MRECPPYKHIFYLEINYAEQNGYLKILIGMMGVGGGACCPPITIDYYPQGVFGGMMGVGVGV